MGPIPESRQELLQLISKAKLQCGLITLAVISSLAVFLMSVLCLSIYEQGSRDEATYVDAIIVLGAAQWGGRPSPVLKARLDHAAYLYSRGIASHMILTGGVGKGEQLSEAEVSRNYILERSIPASAILMEQKGHTSLQSIRAAKRIMDEHGMKSAILVSDPFHMLRILRMAEDCGIQAHGSPTRISPISKSRWVEFKYVVRECVFYLEYLLFKC
jgi:uncharacterized SAM-binding protein YcdF (DUF218 family)